MAKKHGVKSKYEDATPLRRWPRFKTRNPNKPSSISDPKPLSTHPSNLKSTPVSAKPNRINVGKENRIGGKQTRALNDCENGVKSKEKAAAPFRRSPRFKTENPSKHVSISYPEPLSTNQSNLISTPVSAKPKQSNVGKEDRIGGKKTRTANACENVTEKDSFLGSVSARRRSPRLAKTATCSMEQDGGCPPKKRDCKVTKLGLEETCLQSVCEIASEKVPITGSANKQKRMPTSAKVGATNVERRRSPRLVFADTTNNNSYFEVTIKPTRSTKSRKTSLTPKNDTSCTSACPPNIQNKATKNSRKKEGRRKSHRPSDKLEESNCSKDVEIGHASQQCGPSICQNATKKVGCVAPRPPLPPNHRRAKRIGNQSDEITRRYGKDEYDEEPDSEYEPEESPVGKKRKREQSAETGSSVDFSNGQLAGGLDGWTEEQEIALQNAYFSARPSPHFWKKVSKMVPGKNVHDCFNKIQSNFATPPSMPAKSKLNKGSQMESPFRNFNLLEPNSPNDRVCAEPKTRRVSKQKKTREARKTLRNLLKKQKLVDQVKDADYFSQFEASPVSLPSDVKLPSELCKERSQLDPENNLKLAPNQNQPDPSPAVLKQIKNMELHEKYIDHLHCVDARRKACVRACGNKGKEVDLGMKAGELRDAKNALASEAQDFIGCFKKLQADPFGDCTLSDEDDEDIL